MTIVAKSSTQIIAQNTTGTSWFGQAVTFQYLPQSGGSPVTRTMTVAVDGNSASWTSSATADFQSSGGYEGQVILGSGSTQQVALAFNFTVATFLGSP